GHELPGVAPQPGLAVLHRCLGGLGPQAQEHQRDDDQQELDQDEQDDADDLVRRRGFAGDQDVQPAQVDGTGKAAYRTGQHGQPEPGLGQQACPAVFLPLAWLVRLAAPIGAASAGTGAWAGATVLRLGCRRLVATRTPTARSSRPRAKSTPAVTVFCVLIASS